MIWGATRTKHLCNETLTGVLDNGLIIILTCPDYVDWLGVPAPVSYMASCLCILISFGSGRFNIAPNAHYFDFIFHSYFSLG